MARYGLFLGIEGILCTTEHLHRQAWGKVLADIGLSSNCLDGLDMARLSREQCLEAILAANHTELSKAECEVLLREKNEQYRQLLSTLGDEDILPGVKMLLHDLREWGVALCVVTASSNAQLILRSLGMGTFFDAVCDGNDMVTALPTRTDYLRACAYVDVKPDNALVWENTPNRRDEAIRTGLRAFSGDSREARKQTESWQFGTVTV